MATVGGDDVDLLRATRERAARRQVKFLSAREGFLSLRTRRQGFDLI
jgi:hypothetical protein